jgi:hypothetical protein
VGGNQAINQSYIPRRNNKTTLSGCLSRTGDRLCCADLRSVKGVKKIDLRRKVDQQIAKHLGELVQLLLDWQLK